MLTALATIHIVVDTREIPLENISGIRRVHSILDGIRMARTENVLLEHLINKTEDRMEGRD
jgi:hypothetical protein